MLDILRQIYLNSIFYDKKISGKFKENLEFKPSTHLLTSIVKIQTKKINIKDFSVETFWSNKELNDKQINKLNNFFWLFSLDLKSSPTSTQSIIKNWYEINYKYNSKSWNFNITSKRIISWLSNSKLTYDESDEYYKKNFNYIVQKQALHLLNQIDKIKNHLHLN